MILYKILWHLNAFFKIIFFKIIYLNKVSFGKYTTFRKRFNLFIEKNGNVKIGSGVFFNNDCSINCQKCIEIGNDTIFGENVKIYDHNHIFNKKDILIKNQGFKCQNIKIGNNCWICSNVIILPGTTIGDNCVIGAGTIVKGNVKDDSIIRSDNKIIINEII